MAYVLHAGKRYRYSIPYQGERYTIERYLSELHEHPVARGHERLLFLHDNLADVTIESDGPDADELERLINMSEQGKISESQFELELAAYIRQAYDS